MRSMGIDPASQLSGFGLAVDDALTDIAIWKKKASARAGQRMIPFGSTVEALLTFWQPDVVVIEECGPQKNAETFRTLVRFEAIAQYECRRFGIPDERVILVRGPNQVRLDVWGDGSLGKETVYAKCVEAYPDLPWLEFKKGGDDQSDAGTMALGGSKQLTRR